MTTTNRWRLAIFLAAAGVFAGCSSPLREEDILDRLLRSGVPSPPRADGNRAPDPVANRATNDEAALPAHGVALLDLLKRADQVNPQIGAARSAVGIAAGGAWQAGLYPNPSVAVRSGDIGLERDSGDTIVSVTQPIVIGDRLRAAVAAADAEEAAQLADVERVRREVFGEVAELHARVLELAAQLKLIDELLGIAEQTLSIAETRFEARAVAEPDVIRPRVEVFQLRADRQRIARELTAAERRLGLMIESEPVAAERLAGRIPVDPAPLHESALTAAVEQSHPALLAADREIAAAAASLEQIRAERVPDLDLSAGAGYSMEGDQGIVEVGVGATIPLWDRRQGDILSARFELAQRRQSRAVRRNELLSELAEAMGGYNAARDQLRVLREDIVPEAQRAFEQIDASYRAGRTSFIDLLDTQRTLMQSRRTLIELAGSAAVAKARIAAITGMQVLEPAGEHEHEQSVSESPAAPGGAEEIQ